MDSLQEAVDAEAERTRFAGVVRLDRAGVTELAHAYGLADRAHGIPNTVDTVFATASGSKAMTALAVMRLVELGSLGLGTTARSLLGKDLPLVWLEGHDAGVSMTSLHWPSASLTCTVISNWSEGAWPVFKLLDRRLGL